MNKLDSSFRDPNGFIFAENEEVYRCVNEIYKENYDLLMHSGLYKVLTQKGYLIPHSEVKNKPNAYKTLKPLQIPLITYPYEWSFSQLKDAALITLKIQLIALKHNMSLKDATAYNIQFINGAPIFIDTLSFEKYEQGQPWVAYRQFCKHFLAPLLLMTYKDIRLNQLLKTNIDGIEIDLANALLPNITKLNPSIFFHIFLQAKLQKKFENSDIDFKEKSKISKKQLIAMNKNLQDLIKNLEYPKQKSEWGEYYTFTNYNDEAFENKKAIINKFIDIINPETLWDFGANNGLFTRIASERGVTSFAFDIDPVAVEKNYLQIKKYSEKNITPVLFDLINPSPSTGWANKERDCLQNRKKPNCLMALALIHHIAISNNVPLEEMAKYFSSLSKHLIIEFVPKSDSQVQKLFSTRKDIFYNYNEQCFENDFSKYYKITEKHLIKNSQRTLYLMEKKDNE